MYLSSSESQTEDWKLKVFRKKTWCSIECVAKDILNFQIKLFKTIN